MKLSDYRTWDLYPTLFLILVLRLVTSPNPYVFGAMIAVGLAQVLNHWIDAYEHSFEPDDAERKVSDETEDNEATQ